MAASAYYVAHKKLETRTVTLVAPATMCRAIGYDSLQVTSPAARFWGIAECGGIAGDRISIVTEGSYPVEAGAAITIGSPLTTDAQGRLVPATTGQYVAARALGTVGGAGQFVEVHITREGTL